MHDDFKAGLEDVIAARSAICAIALENSIGSGICDPAPC